MTMAQEALVPVVPKAWSFPKSRAIDTNIVVLPFFDDFSDYEGAPNFSLWLTRDALVNKDFDFYPPTVGMVTLDAVDCNGRLHKGASSSLFSADTLASQFIRLDSIFSPTHRSLSISDSIRLSFYYLPGGGVGHQWERIGDAPEASDSLFLEFFNPVFSQWEIVWSCGGECVDSLIARTGKSWQYVSIPILKSDFLSSRFQFRFRNYCSLDSNPKIGMVGNCDNWNLDYIRLAVGRSYNDVYSRDVAFVKKAPSFLNRYQSMPARQYSQSDMASSVDITISNLYSQVLTSSYSFKVIDSEGNEIFMYDGGHENITPFLPNGNYQLSPAHAHPSLNGFEYSPSEESSIYQILHVLKEGSAGDAHQQNDTMTFSQVFSDYFAYDDGTAENGYGVTSTSNRVDLACRYDLRVSDTLTAVDLYFNHTRNEENELLPFQICVWRVNIDGCPGQLLYKDRNKFYSRYGDSLGFVRYRLTEPIVVDGSVFIGIEQLSNAYLNLGFDRNNDASQYVFYRTSADWQQSILKGALMMRPHFGHKAFLEIPQTTSSFNLSVYPNPASDEIHLSSLFVDEELQLTIFDSYGKKLYEGPYSSTLDVSTLTNGLYIIQLVELKTKSRIQKKLIIIR